MQPSVEMDLPQRFPLASAVVDAIDIPPSICGQMGQQDPHVQHPSPLDAMPRRDLPYSSIGAAAAADGCGRR